MLLFLINAYQAFSLTISYFYTVKRRIFYEYTCFLMKSYIIGTCIHLLLVGLILDLTTRKDKPSENHACSITVERTPYSMYAC